MNSLSWLLYVAQVLPSIMPLLIVLGVGVIAACGVLLIYGCHERDGAGNGFGYGHPGRENAIRATPRWQAGFAAQKRGLKLLPLCIPFFLLAVAVPSRETILMIAASEMGEAVVKTPEAQEIFGDLKTILKKQLEELKK